MTNRRVLEEMAGLRKSRLERQCERELSHIRRATRRAQEAADMVSKINERLKARDVLNAPDLSK